MPRLVQYKALTETLRSLTVEEAITVDKWNAVPQPVPRGLKMAVALIATSCFFTSAQAMTEPEAPQLDKWEPKAPAIVFDINRRQYSYPFEFNDPFNLTQSERITPDKWTGRYPDYVFDLKRSPWTYPAHFFHPEPLEVTELVTIEPFTQEPSFIFEKRRQQFSYPSFFLEHFGATQPETAQIDKWRGWRPDIHFGRQRTQYLYPNFFYDARHFTEGERITPDKWLPEFPDTIFGIERRQHAYPNYFVRERTQFQYETKLFAAFRPTGQWPGDITRNQYLAPSFFFHPEPLEIVEFISFETYTQEAVKVYDIARRQYTYPSFFIEHFGATQGERITLDKWEPSYPDKIFRAKKTQWSYPTLFLHSEPKEVTELIAIEIYTQEPAFVRTVRRWQHLNPIIGAFDPLPITVVEAVTLDKWFLQRPEKVYDRKRIQYLYAWWSGIEKEAERGACIHPKEPLSSNIFTQEALEANVLTKELLAANTLTKEALAANILTKESLAANTFTKEGLSC